MLRLPLPFFLPFLVPILVLVHVFVFVFVFVFVLSSSSSSSPSSSSVLLLHLFFSSLTFLSRLPFFCFFLFICNTYLIVAITRFVTVRVEEVRVASRELPKSDMSGVIVRRLVDTSSRML